MANFLLICDPDPVRREAAAHRAYKQVTFTPRLRAELRLTAHYAITWAAAPDAPVEVRGGAEPASCEAILFGEPHVDSGERVTAAELCRVYERTPEARLALNGYYAAVLIDPRRGIRVEADVLGVFPIYYWQRGDVVLVATSPGLFRCHPSFEPQPDLHGIAALLLTSGLAGGRTLWRGVKRLAADHVLATVKGESVKELSPAAPPEEPSIQDPNDTVHEAAALHRAFLKRALASSRQPGLLLSGGLDSRLLAGFICGLDRRPECVTFGRHEDLDARCALQVARELNLPQTLCDVRPEDYAAQALASVTWEQLSGGLYALPMGWNLSLRPPAVSIDRLVCGLTLDAVIGGAKHVADSSRGLPFEALRVAQLGYQRARLDPLLASPELARACDEVREQLVESYRSAERSDDQREWRMNLAHRHRFAVGTCAWRYSLFAWPVLPALDRRLLRLAARLPATLTRDRQIQTRMLISEFPRLARLDLDRNYFDTLPLLSSPRSRLFDLQRRLVKVQRRVFGAMGRDPRFYVRTMEINGPGWRVVRTLADGTRTIAHAFFRADALARMLPQSRVTIRRLGDPIIDSAPLKNTLGLILWLRQHA